MHIALLLSCAGPDEPGTPPSDTAPPTAPADPCADPVVPDNVITLETADGPGEITLFDIGWVYYGTDTTLESQWEAARFELAHPAEVVGFAVQWTNLGPKLEPTDPVEAGLYPDFGYNGFDFDAPAPYATVSRCAQDVVDGAWTEYLLPEPVVIDDPGLVYVAHHKARKSDPVWWMDASYTDGYCAAFDACDASWNFPDLDPNYYNGVSVILPYDYLVRLYVRYTDDLTPSETQFQAVEGPSFGSRTAWGDFDNDGWDDLVTSGLALWRNDGGTLVNVTAGSGLESVPSGGAIWGDMDNDGCLDLFAINEGYTGQEWLLRGHCDGTFEDISATSGLDDTQGDIDCTDDPYDVESANTAAAAWVDLDADGLLDLYLANMICWSQYTYYDDRVWHNLGGGAFEDWSFTRGFLPDENLSGRGIAPADADGDGDVDLFVNNYTLHRNLYYENLGDGTFDETALHVGLAGDNDGAYYGHTIGAAWGDLDNDGNLDMVHGNLAHPRFFDFSDKSKVLLNDGAGAFADVSDGSGLRYQETYSVPALADFDGDGNLDLVLTAVYDGRPTDTYFGRGDGTFALDSYHAGITTENGWGVSTADVDHDGDPDVATYQLFRNDAPATGDWLQVGLIGDVASNRFGLGATVRATSPGAVRTRVISGGTGQGGQDAPIAHFAFPAGTAVERLTVTWPGGAEVVVDDPPVGVRLWVRESGGSEPGWARPDFD
jgi:hypothetical protein